MGAFYYHENAFYLGLSYLTIYPLESLENCAKRIITDLPDRALGLDFSYLRGLGRPNGTK